MLKNSFYYSIQIADDVQKLLMGERASLHSLTYMILILMAYYGPNAELLGNIKLAIWHFDRPITDIDAYLFNITLLLVVDLLSLVFNGILIWYHCNINILKMIQISQKEFWHVFAFVEAFILNEVNRSEFITYLSSFHSWYFLFL